MGDEDASSQVVPLIIVWVETGKFDTTVCVEVTVLAGRVMVLNMGI